MPVHPVFESILEAICPQTHDCTDHLRYRREDYEETHGLDCGPYERWTDEWWECSICKECYTGEELDKMAEQEQEKVAA